MTEHKKQCPECRTRLKAVTLSNLMEERGGPSLGAQLTTEITILELFSFYVCAQCGRTLIYAGAIVRRIASGETRDSDEGLIGIS
jgi:predicted RNA-binding Zn-ribbon protein involved in translation (DUF1610 family)